MPTAHGSVRSNSDWYEGGSPRSKRSWKARTYASATRTPSITSWGSEWRCSGKLAERRRRRIRAMVVALKAARARPISVLMTARPDLGDFARAPRLHEQGLAADGDDAIDLLRRSVAERLDLDTL